MQLIELIDNSTLKVQNIHSRGNLYSLLETGQYRQYAATHDRQLLLLERPWRIIETIDLRPWIN